VHITHREIFEQAEAESSLYARFLALTSKFDLVPAGACHLKSSNSSLELAGREMISSSSDPSIPIGGISEHPTTGNAVACVSEGIELTQWSFANIEFSGVADELAVEARADEFDATYEVEAPKSARLITETFPVNPSGGRTGGRGCRI
jgi:hypothetical protein